MKKAKKRIAAEFQLHIDQGFHYTSQAYHSLTQSYGITPSMSGRGNPYDHAMAENFFSILKIECIYRHKPNYFSEANVLIDRHIQFFNHERIQLKTGVSPLPLRHAGQSFFLLKAFFVQSVYYGAAPSQRRCFFQKYYNRNRNSFQDLQLPPFVIEYTP